MPDIIRALAEPDTLDGQPIDEFLDVPEPEAVTTADVIDAAKKSRKKTADEINRDAQRALVGGLHVMGYARAEIAAILDVHINTVDRVLAKLRKDRQLKEGFQETLERIENEALPLAMDSLLEHLKKHDKDITIEVLKGRGVFRNFSSNKNEGPSAVPQRSFVVNIVNAPGQASIVVPEDAIRGVPRTLDSGPVDDATGEGS